jgi:hypothetical protein
MHRHTVRRQNQRDPKNPPGTGDEDAKLGPHQQKRYHSFLSSGTTAQINNRLFWGQNHIKQLTARLNAGYEGEYVYTLTYRSISSNRDNPDHLRPLQNRQMANPLFGHFPHTVLDTVARTRRHHLPRHDIPHWAYPLRTAPSG